MILYVCSECGEDCQGRNRIWPAGVSVYQVAENGEKVELELM